MSGRKRRAGRKRRSSFSTLSEAPSVPIAQESHTQVGGASSSINACRRRAGREGRANFPAQLKVTSVPIAQDSHTQVGPPIAQESHTQVGGVSSSINACKRGPGRKRKAIFSTQLEATSVPIAQESHKQAGGASSSINVCQRRTGRQRRANFSTQLEATSVLIAQDSHRQVGPPVAEESHKQVGGISSSINAFQRRADRKIRTHISTQLEATSVPIAQDSHTQVEGASSSINALKRKAGRKRRAILSTQFEATSASIAQDSHTQVGGAGSSINTCQRRTGRKRRANFSTQSEATSVPIAQDSHTQVVGACNSINTASSSRKKRSISRGLNNFGRRPGEKLKVEWNKLGQPTGDNATRFANLLGTTLRLDNLISLRTEGWSEISEDAKDKIWNEILNETDIDESRKKWVMQSLGTKYSSWRNKLKKNFKAKDKYEDRIANCPSNVTKADWIWLVDYWSRPEVEAVACKNSDSRRKQVIPHTGGTKSFARCAKELTSDECPPNRIVMFRRTHTKDGGKGSPINEHAAAILAKFDEWSATQDSTSISADEYFMQIMGPERHGRVRGYGLGPTPSSVFSQASHGTYSQVCNRLKNVLDEMEKMKATMAQQIQVEREKREQTERQVDQILEVSRRQLEQMHEENQRKMQDQMQQFMQQSMKQFMQQFRPSGH